MESFIQEIYHDASIIEYLKESISCTNRGRFLDARSVYDTAAGILEQMLIRLAKSNPEDAVRIQNIALNIKEVFEDFCLSKGLIQGRLIPELYAYISNFTGIEVTDGKYTIKSSDTGYLTVRDNEYDIYLHDTYDPMWEAYEIAKTVILPGTERILIFGSGLGYLAYQIWKCSEESIDIVIYEEDSLMLSHAFDYGVLSLIPEDNLSIIHFENPEELISIFLDDLSQNEVFVFSHWKKQKYKELNNEELGRILVNHDFDMEMNERSATNLALNRKHPSISFEELKAGYSYDEWIIVSAGPSFDECVPFLKEKKDTCGIIAVNTVLKRLYKEKIIPDICAAADQYVQLYDHIKGIEDFTNNIPLIADYLLNWKFVKAYKGPICFIRTSASAGLTEELSGSEPVWELSGTVACLAVEAAILMNAKRIYLIGQDLAYPDGRRYAEGMPHAEISNIGYDLEVPSVNGKMIGTCEAFNWFRKALEYQISKHSSIEFVNLSKNGALIKGAKLVNDLE